MKAARPKPVSILSYVNNYPAENCKTVFLYLYTCTAVPRPSVPQRPAVVLHIVHKYTYKCGKSMLTKGAVLIFLVEYAVWQSTRH